MCTQVLWWWLLGEGKSASKIGKVSSRLVGCGREISGRTPFNALAWGLEDNDIVGKCLFRRAKVVHVILLLCEKACKYLCRLMLSNDYFILSCRQGFLASRVEYFALGGLCWQLIHTYDVITLLFKILKPPKNLILRDV